MFDTILNLGATKKFIRNSGKIQVTRFFKKHKKVVQTKGMVRTTNISIFTYTDL